MSLLIGPSARVVVRRTPLVLAEEPHFDPRAVRRAISEIERQGGASRFAVRSELEGFSVADARRALAGLPAPGGYQLVVKPLRYRTPPPLAVLCEFAGGRLTLGLPEPFRPFSELVY